MIPNRSHCLLSVFSSFFIIFLLAGGLLLPTGCGSEESGKEVDLQLPPPPPPPRFVGYYEADAGSDTLVGPLLSLILMADKGAEMITDSLNYKPETIEIGDWSQLDENKIDVYLTNLETGGNRSVNLQLIGENLLWADETQYLVFSPADQVIGRIRELIMWVGPDKTPCSAESKEQCFRVSYGDTKSPGPLQTFYDPIQGFLWHPGTAYKIKVKETYKGASEASASSVKYELVEILFSQAME